MLDQKHALMLAFHRRDRYTGPSQSAQHRGFGADRRAALRDRATPIRAAQQQHLGQISAGQAFDPVLRRAGQARDAVGEGAYPGPGSPGSGRELRAPAVTSAQVWSKCVLSP
jgi:hypothetical protein